MAVKTKLGFVVSKVAVPPASSRTRMAAWMVARPGTRVVLGRDGSRVGSDDGAALGVIGTGVVLDPTLVGVALADAALLYVVGDAVCVFRRGELTRVLELDPGWRVQRAGVPRTTLVWDPVVRTRGSAFVEAVPCLPGRGGRAATGPGLGLLTVLPYAWRATLPDYIGVHGDGRLSLAGAFVGTWVGVHTWGTIDTEIKEV